MVEVVPLFADGVLNAANLIKARVPSITLDRLLTLTKDQAVVSNQSNLVSRDRPAHI